MAKRRTGVGKMKRTTSKKTPKRLAAKKEKLRAKKILFKASRAGKAAAPKK